MGKGLGYFLKEDIGMANTPLKMGSTSVVITEMQIITTVRYHNIPTGMAKIKMTDNAKYWQR